MTQVIEPIELSLGENPKNKRRFLAMKDKDGNIIEPTDVVTDAVPEVEDPSGVAGEVIVEPVLASAPETDPGTLITDRKPVEGALPEVIAPVSEPLNVGSEDIAMKAFQALRRKAVPQNVADAMAKVVQRAGFEANDEASVLDAEAQVHVLSLLGIIPADAPEDVVESMATIKSLSLIHI